VAGIYVVGLGASTPVGRDAWSSAAAVRAGISGFTNHPYMLDSAGEPMRVALAPWVDPHLEGAERLLALLFPTIDDVLRPIIDSDSTRVALSLGLAAPRPGLPEDLSLQLKRAVSKGYSNRFTGIATFANGHAAGLLALDAAVKKLREGAFDACVVAGVDSYMMPETLEWLEKNDQLHGAGVLNNAWGFIPGEAAGAFLIATEDAARRLAVPPLASLRGLGVGVERHRIKTETVCIGEGLTQAFRAALSELPEGTRISDVYCDMNGEPYRADEYGFACLRTKEWFNSASDFVSPADCWGDISAATSPLCVCLAAIASHKGYANGPLAFVWTSSEGGERAAVLLEATTWNGGP